MARPRELALVGIAIASVAAMSLVGSGSAESRPRGAVENCQRISGFGASLRDFTRPQNLVVGPLALLRAGRPWAYRLEGEKLFVVVKGGHRVTLELSPETRRGAGLVFGRFRNPNVRLRDARRVVTLVACQRGESFDEDLDGWPVSGWVGGVLASSPRCVPLRVWVDDDPRPRRAVIRFGVRSCG
jgi:hypothetical protein